MARDSLGRGVAAPITWGTSDSAVATINATGALTALTTGTIWVTAQAGTQRDSLPLRVTRSWIAVSVGDAGACVLGLDSLAHCWGAPKLTPTIWATTPLAVNSSPHFRQLDLGVEAACGVGDDGLPRCWGGVNYGNRLGRDDYVGGYLPSAPDLVIGGFPLEVISTGREHQCGLVATGEAYCWGINRYGETGDGGPIGVVWQRPVRVLGAQAWRAVEAGPSRTCGLTAAGAALCWGDNRSNFLGVSPSETVIPTPLPVTGGGTYDRLALGSRHQCALTAAGRVECWGSNDAGALGLGVVDATVRPPTPVSGGPYTTIAAGGYLTCAVAVGDVAFCWGAGQPTPTPVPLRRFAAIDVGIDLACGVTPGGAAYCWSTSIGVINPWRVPDP